MLLWLVPPTAKVSHWNNWVNIWEPSSHPISLKSSTFQWLTMSPQTIPILHSLSLCSLTLMHLWPCSPFLPTTQILKVWERSMTFQPISSKINPKGSQIQKKIHHLFVSMWEIKVFWCSSLPLRMKETTNQVGFGCLLLELSRWSTLNIWSWSERTK